VICGNCGEENPERARFCFGCGSKLEAEAAARGEVRKTVTVLFSDLAGSTALGERIDPEQMRALMARYFAAMQAVIERHGGTVEKFIGDAIMAVFGIPVLHEDDALRAVRASVEMRQALDRFNANLATERGLTISTRTGINTGEVVAGTSDGGTTLVTGDPVNTAARLEQVAGADEILLGAATWQLVRDAVTVEPIEAISAKGKALDVPAYRLVSVRTGAEGHTRRMDAPLVGRERELRILRQARERVVEDRAPQLFTLLGAAGVGKSRLVSEFLGALEGVTVVSGRCLSYGDGITYWPLAEALKSAAGIDESDSADAARAKLHELVIGEREGELLAERLGEVIGLTSAGAPQEEIFWAVRRSLEWIARRRPLVVVWDDIQWAEPTFLDLVEHLADWSRDAPLLLLAMARPELLDARPGWGGGKLNATTVLLEPLPAEATEGLINALPGGAALPSSLRRRIAEAAEGNPLFVEEMLAMLVDEGRLILASEGWEAAGDLKHVPVPPTITALLAARLERLGPGERGVAERASVVGRIFERGAVLELTPPQDRSDLTAHLLALVRKELVRAESEPGIGGDDAYRFRHLLIRDAAYGSLPKAERASLHEAFADWLERMVGDRLGEYEEIIAHHLEQAYGYRKELGDGDPAVEELGERAGRRLAAAARRALMRGDQPGSLVLHRRALALPLAAEERASLGVRLARILVDSGEWDEAGRVLDEVDRHVALTDEARWRMHVVVGRGFIALEQDQAPNYEAIEAGAREAMEAFEPMDDALGMARALDLLAFCSYFRLDLETAGPAWRSAAEWAARAGDAAEEARLLPFLPATATYGWDPTSVAIAYCRELGAAHPDSPMLQARALAMSAWMHAERGEFDQALARREESRAASGELGLPWLTSETHGMYADVDLLMGEWRAAEREALAGYEMALEHGKKGPAANAIVTMMLALYRQGRTDEARSWLERARGLHGTTGVEIAQWLDLWRALLAAVDGDRQLARSLLEATDHDLYPWDRAPFVILRAEVLEQLGEQAAAADALRSALAVSERLEMFVRAADARQRLEALAPHLPPAP